MNVVPLAKTVPFGILEIVIFVLFSVAKTEKKFNSPLILVLFNIAPALKRFPKALIPFATKPPACGKFPALFTPALVLTFTYINPSLSMIYPLFKTFPVLILGSNN